VPRALARLVAVAALAVAASACGYDTSATFNADGSVVVGLKFLFPKELMQGGGGTSVSGFSVADIAKANQQLQSKYPGGKVAVVTEGDESGALVTIPFKTEKDAFAFLTQPSALSPSAGSSATSSPTINLANTGGMFKSATHTSNGGNDTYSFQTQPAQMTSPSPGSGVTLSEGEIASIFTITFALTVPHVITSAPGALFTLDRKTAIWKLDWTKSQSLTATTGSDAGLVASVGGSGTGQDPRLLVSVGFAAIAAGFLLGIFVAWRGLWRRQDPAPAGATGAAPTPIAATPPFEPPMGLPGPPPGAPPPTVS
jgi:hypothetical protein